MLKENEPDKKQIIYKEIPKGGIDDPRFETPVMAIDLTAGCVSKEYQEHLKNGGDKIAG